MPHNMPFCNADVFKSGEQIRFDSPFYIDFIKRVDQVCTTNNRGAPHRESYPV